MEGKKNLVNLFKQKERWRKIVYTYNYTYFFFLFTGDLIKPFERNVCVCDDSNNQ